MRVLFATWAWSTHYYPMVPLAWACRAEGLDVRVASQPELTSTIRATGLPAVRVGRDVDAAGLYRTRVHPMMDYGADGGLTPEELAARDRERHLTALGLYVEIMEAMAPDLLEFARAWRPDAVVYDPMTWAAPLAARELGVPAVRNLFGPDIGYRFRPEGEGVLDPLMAALGTREPDTVGDLTVDPCPPALQNDAPLKRCRFSYVPFSGLSDVPPRVHERSARPRVCLTWGTSTDRLTGRESFLPGDVLGAVASAGADVVLAITARQRSLLPDLPARVRVVESVPLDVLLPTCDVVVHQGGGGTTLTAAKYGVPQLHLPQLPDQMINSRHLAATGAGLLLRSDEASSDAVRDCVRRLLEEGSPHRAAATTLAGDMAAQPALSTVVEEIVRLAA
ncbi:nucleotide disphospho-sugar-binding domain-containing protein [Nonomuraea glycinis]|uniref:nucleotide disphospho-sugar-binding domain-containing protein n=1 Tax=Nonomuraea glycinis TaxID=2047744 RepID=UPI0033AAA89E